MFRHLTSIHSPPTLSLEASPGPTVLPSAVSSLRPWLYSCSEPQRREEPPQARAWLPCFLDAHGGQSPTPARSGRDRLALANPQRVCLNVKLNPKRAPEAGPVRAPPCFFRPLHCAGGPWESPYCLTLCKGTDGGAMGGRG